jgi:hypothetical protein
VKTEDVTSNRGAVLLKELKALVDSFPEHRRKELVRTVKSVISELDEQSGSEHSATPTAHLGTGLIPGFTRNETK